MVSYISISLCDCCCCSMRYSDYDEKRKVKEKIKREHFSPPYMLLAFCLTKQELDYVFMT